MGFLTWKNLKLRRKQQDEILENVKESKSLKLSP